MAPSIDTEDLLNGATLRVVLHPNRDVQTDFPDMIESFELPHITLSGKRFFAKTANRHAVSFQFKDYDINEAFAYAYSNHYDFVVNSSHTGGYSRILSKKVYQDVTLIAQHNYELIWDSEKDRSVERVETEILNGRRLKIALLDEEGIWNIHPVHMPSFYVDKNFFELFTDQDAMPEFLRHPKELDSISKKYKALLSDYIVKNKPKTMATAYSSVTMMNPNTDFYSSYYTVRSNGGYLRGKTVLLQEEPLSYKALRVFADAG